jgi:hypothetical protein
LASLYGSSGGKSADHQFEEGGVGCRDLSRRYKTKIPECFALSSGSTWIEISGAVGHRRGHYRKGDERTQKQRVTCVIFSRRKVCLGRRRRQSLSCVPYHRGMVRIVAVLLMTDALGEVEGVGGLDQANRIAVLH